LTPTNQAHETRYTPQPSSQISLQTVCTGAVPSRRPQLGSDNRGVWWYYPRQERLLSVWKTEIWAGLLPI